MWAAVVLMAVNDAFGDTINRTELDRAEALRFLLSPHGAWARSREEVCSCAGAEAGRLHLWALDVMAGKVACGEPKEVQLSRDLWAALNAPREKPKPTEKAEIAPAPDAGAIRFRPSSRLMGSSTFGKTAPLSARTPDRWQGRTCRVRTPSKGAS